ncbi:MAG: methyl-accepting chemotaxis protein [Phycisphaerales bacterium]|nr:methyl-accepting chemotaxis protein [Phycisphaerales bacterium]
MDTRVPIFKGLKFRMMLAGVLPTVIVMTVLIWGEARHEYTALRAASLESLQTQADLLAEYVQEVNESARECVFSLSDAQSAGMINHGQMSVDFSRSILEREATITAVFMVFEPDTHQLEQLADIPGEAMVNDDRLAPYWFIDPDQGDTIRLEPAPSIDEGSYYAMPREQWMRSGEQSLCISEPYLNEGRLQIDMSTSILIGGQFTGVAGVSRALDDQDRQLREFIGDRSLEAFLLTPYGRFIASSTDEVRLDNRDLTGQLKTRSIDDTPYADIFDIVDLSATRDIIEAIDPVTGQQTFFATSPVRTGNWTVVLSRSEEAVLAPIYAFIIESIAIGIIGLIIIVTFLSILAIKVSRRVRNAMDYASRIAEGDLSQMELVVRSSDETGILLNVMSQMSHRLRMLVGHLIDSGSGIDRAAGVVSSSTEEQVTVAAHLEKSTDQICNAVDRIMSTSENLNRTVASVSDVADQTATLASTGQTDLEHMRDAMEQLESSTETADRRLVTIKERASGISGIVSTITAVADQTNLLSVNASIEAEKAGDAGRGFLVVAREIRRLADRTASATLEIESSVRDVEVAIGEGVRDLGRFSEEVRRIVVDVARLSQSMGSILEQVAASNERFHELRDGVLSQAQGASEISETMEGLQEGTIRTIRTTESLVKASANLEKAVETLGGIVSSFHLGETSPEEHDSSD